MFKYGDKVSYIGSEDCYRGITFTVLKNYFNTNEVRCYIYDEGSINSYDFYTFKVNDVMTVGKDNKLKEFQVGDKVVYVGDNEWYFTEIYTFKGLTNGSHTAMLESILPNGILNSVTCNVTSLTHYTETKVNNVINTSSSWKQEGRCLQCGELGSFINLQAVCSKHGVY